MRKRLFLAALAAIVGTATAIAQQIAVVSEGGGTNVFQTLTEAIEGASDGSVIYLPGGGFQIDDSVKITKRLTIIGIGHKAKNENVDGNTTIVGNLFFNEGASGSSVMGCFLSGNVFIGEDGTSVNNVVIKYCNLNGVTVKNSLCSSTFINQNYIRGECDFAWADCNITNNVCNALNTINGGKIVNNLIIHGGAPFSNVNNSTIVNNVSIYIGGSLPGGSWYQFNNNIVSGNMRTIKGWGEDPICIEGINLNTVFTKYNGGAISPSSDFHFTEEYQQYSDCGIYGGTGFSDGQLPPVPFIVAKSIPEQTDASGNLNIKIRVKASE